MKQKTVFEYGSQQKVEKIPTKKCPLSIITSVFEITIELMKSTSLCVSRQNSLHFAPLGVKIELYFHCQAKT